MAVDAHSFLPGVLAAFFEGYPAVANGRTKAKDAVEEAEGKGNADDADCGFDSDFGLVWCAFVVRQRGSGGHDCRKIVCGSN